MGNGSSSLSNRGADRLFSDFKAVAFLLGFRLVYRIAYFYLMKISFGTKEEHKRLKQEEFLALAPIERVYSFLRLSERIAQFPSRVESKKENSNFVIKPKSKE